jgi:hypothetical protein
MFSENQRMIDFSGSKLRETRSGTIFHLPHVATCTCGWKKEETTVTSQQQKEEGRQQVQILQFETSGDSNHSR